MSIENAITHLKAAEGSRDPRFRLTHAKRAMAAISAVIREANEELASRSASGDPLECPECHGPVVVLGALGNFTHLRCRNCGVDFHEDAADCGFPDVPGEEG